MSSVSTLNVLLHGALIGTITHVGADRSLFAFTDDYIADRNRATLSLGFKDSLGELIADFRPYQTRLMPFFSNLLPEDTLRTYLAARAGVNPEREFFLLWALGRDLPGAVVVEPAEGEAQPPVDERIAQASSDKALRFSLAGVQLKFSAAVKANGGLTVPVDGAGGSWIVKLPWHLHEGVPENEYAMMQLARQIGINVPESTLLDIHNIENIPEGLERFGSTAFAIKRFDRSEGGAAVHIEDFAQVFGVYPHNKYNKASMRNIAEVVGIEGQDQDVMELIRRLVFNVLIGNADMHLKNWSLIYHDRRNASLAPAYDFVSTIPYIADETLALRVSRSKRFDEVDMDELRHLAVKARLPQKMVLDVAQETVARFNEAWTSEKSHLPLSRHLIETIDKHLKNLPIRKSTRSSTKG